MKKVIIASKNPVKINSVKNAFGRIFPDEAFEFEGISVPSGVSDQPMSEKETLEGATNRASNASAKKQGDYFLGIEGGIEDGANGMAGFAWVVTLSKGKKGMGRTGSFFVPEKVATLIRQGMEMGEADDIVFGKSNSKQQNGAVGLLTDNALTRTKYYEQAVILALIPFKNPELY